MDIAQLKAIPQWVGWKIEHRNGKPSKVPKHAKYNGMASSIDPATWGTAADAWTSKKRFGYDGIGFVFTIKSGVVGVDLDACFVGDGRTFADLQPWAHDIVCTLNSYTEFSPSGNGLHVLCRGALPEACQWESGDDAIDGKRPGVEMYCEGRYFTITGRRLDSTLPYIMDRPDELLAVFVACGGDLNEPARLPDVEPARHDVTERDIAEMLAVIDFWGDYNTFYLPVLMAVHSVFPDERGVRLLAAHWPDYEREIRRKFRSFDRTAKSGVTIATLVQFAKDTGRWSPPARPTQKRPYTGRRSTDITDALTSRGTQHGTVTIAA